MSIELRRELLNEKIRAVRLERDLVQSRAEALVLRVQREHSAMVKKLSTHLDELEKELAGLGAEQEQKKELSCETLP